MIDTDAPTIAERYVRAGSSSNLRCETGDDAPMGDAAILIAAGWSASRIGAALMRLHTKVDRTTLEQVHEQLTMQAERWRIEQPMTVAAAVLGWWLQHVCGKCHGVRFELVPGTPALSNRQCKACKGSGEDVIPYGNNGKRIAGFMDDCKSRAASGIRNRLKAMK